MSNAAAVEREVVWRSQGFARAYVFLAAFLTATGWVLSAFQRLTWIGGVFIVGLIAAIAIARRPYATWTDCVRDLAAPFRSGWVIAVAGFILAGALLYPPGMLDSLTYRVPRVLLWLEHNGVYHVESAEPRLNYLCHVWELCTAPIILLAGVRCSWFWSFLSWLVCQTVFYHWGLRLGQSAGRARRLALLVNTSTFAVLQAQETSNDLLAATLLVLALEFAWRYESRRQPGDINWSALSLALCTGVKPHFAVMGLPFVVWFVAARSQPWRAFGWRLAPVVLAVCVLCSAIPTFALNQKHYGKVTGPEQDDIYQRSGPAMNIFAGTILMTWQALQPGINPAALVLNGPLERAANASGLPQRSPRFSLQMVPAAITDGASFGLITFAALLAGWWLGCRREKPGWLSLPVLATTAGAFGFVAAVSQFLPGSVGRSFLAFGLLAVPLAMVGWRRFPDRAVAIFLWLGVGMALLVVIFNPARPLWPAAAVRDALARSGQAGVVRALDAYLMFRSRAEAGRSLADQVPDGEAAFVVLIGEDRPLLPVLTSRHGAGAVRLLRAKAAPAELLALGPRFVLVCDPDGQDYAELVSFLAGGSQHRVHATAEYVSKIRRGRETWTLYAPRSAGAIPEPPSP